MGTYNLDEHISLNRSHLVHVPSCIIDYSSVGLNNAEIATKFPEHVNFGFTLALSFRSSISPCGFTPCVFKSQLGQPFTSQPISPSIQLRNSLHSITIFRNPNPSPACGRLPLTALPSIRFRPHPHRTPGPQFARYSDPVLNWATPPP